MLSIAGRCCLKLVAFILVVSFLTRGLASFVQATVS
jgi:hypothetical protein